MIDEGQRRPGPVLGVLQVLLVPGEFVSQSERVARPARGENVRAVQRHLPHLRPARHTVLAQVLEALKGLGEHRLVGGRSGIAQHGPKRRRDNAGIRVARIAEVCPRLIGPEHPAPVLLTPGEAVLAPGGGVPEGIRHAARMESAGDIT